MVGAQINLQFEPKSDLFFLPQSSLIFYPFNSLSQNSARKLVQNYMLPVFRLTQAVSNLNCGV